MERRISIFNDVLGPVMRGPSSSHTAGAYRIGQIAAQLLGGSKLKTVTVEFSSKGSLATTYCSQGSEFGLLSGLLGIPMESEKVLNSKEIFSNSGMTENIVINNESCSHPNQYELTLETEAGEKIKIVGISLGGGMVRIVNVNGMETCIEGDTEVKLDGYAPIKPILPVTSSSNSSMPFLDASAFESILSSNVSKREMWEYAIDYESAIGGLSRGTVMEYAEYILDTMEKSIQFGLNGTFYEDRILGRQSHLIDEGIKKKRLLPSPLINRISKYALAIMECKSAYGVIVASPTAGSCAVLPSALFACRDEYGYDKRDMIKALLAGGLTGVFIAKDATFSAEVAGCQAECGAGSAMTAAAITQLAGGSGEECLGSASFAMQNILGMICDPIAKRVEAPCLGRNIMCSLNAVAAANLSLAGVDSLIPFHEVVKVMGKVGHSLPGELRCTGKGGLSLCKTSLEIEKKLNSNG